jgi:hypothetical protein
MKTPIVYLTEQPSTSFNEALRRANLAGRPDFIVLFFHDTIGASWPDVVDAAFREMEARRAKVLVIDTLPQFARLRGDSENSSGEALAAIEPLQLVASRGNAVWLNRHEKKGFAEIGESARGSSAFSGVVDIILTLRPGEGATSPTVRLIRSLSRFDATPSELMVNYVDGTYTALGTVKQVAQYEARQTLIETMPTGEAEAMTLDELVQATELKRTTVQQALKKMMGDGSVAQTGEGKKGSPRRFYLKFIPPEPPVVPAETISPNTSGNPEKSSDIHSAGTNTLNSGRKNFDDETLSNESDPMEF